MVTKLSVRVETIAVKKELDNVCVCLEVIKIYCWWV
jgi:hypothetical protein